ncbi:MAG TPA: hypothetical protein DIT01_09920 [Lentisphaeria bacterium]|nr:hypothetical protein [Lentisphaeria bacterium]
MRQLDARRLPRVKVQKHFTLIELLVVMAVLTNLCTPTYR